MGNLLQVLNSALTTLSRWLLRAVVVLAGLVFGLSLLAAGVVVGLGVLLWSLVRGRRPTVLQFRRFTQARWGGFAGAPFAQPAKPQGEVIDIEAREVSPQGEAQRRPVEPAPPALRRER